MFDPGVCSTLRFAQHSVGAMNASRGEWSLNELGIRHPPQSPHWGELGGNSVMHQNIGGFVGKKTLGRARSKNQCLVLSMAFIAAQVGGYRR